MEFQHDKSWDCLASIFASKLSAKDAWIRFIDFHEQTVPKSYWTFLKQLDIDGEQKEITQWLQKLVTDSPIPNNVVALWIGILKFADNEKEIPAIYLAGANTYDKDDIDWACNPTYLPENRYAQLELLQQIDDIAGKDEANYEFLDWILPLAYCTLMFDEIIRTKLDKKLVLKNKDNLFMAVGHDSGDYMDLTTIE
jgi:hypothetical protein